MELNHTALHEGRLSRILREEMGLSAGLMNRLKWTGALKVNGQSVHTDFPVQPGDTVTAVVEEERPDYPAEDLPLTILYEDDFLLAVDKPQGMLIHPSSARNTGTLANAVAGYYRRTGSTGAFHPLTRLDRDTFGIVLVAKNGYACALLQRSRPRKTYHALTLGGPASDSGIIDAPIARKPLPSLLREIRPDGKPSRTEYRVLERGEALCRLALTPVTGRTHQLRLHCAYMGFPIVGDPQYGSAEALTWAERLGVSGQQLCAKRLELSHPVTGQALVLESGMDVLPASRL
ncbi:MAG: RluA family pseudouridine synthase [Clostridiales bacterium]|nr:RluA family pseudouridine synthase [Clostridiales bacterium]